jgi:hypothetical protein
MNGKPLALNIFCYLKAEVRMDKMMEGRPGKSLFLGNLWSWENRGQTHRTVIFLDPQISQDQNLERKEAHRTTSKLTVFAFVFQLIITVITQPF